MKTLDLQEAAAFLRMHPETLRQRAAVHPARHADRLTPARSGLRLFRSLHNRRPGLAS